jgi:outer membrane receptor protein involved in Fe transport
LPDQANPPPCAPGTSPTNGSCVVVTPQGKPANESNSNAIVVTGSRIQRPNLESPVPITSISQQELSQQGQVSVGDALNDLPALRSTFSQQNSGRFIGTAGENFLDLRGLGTNRTLVLVNGRRFVTGAVGDFVVDVDNIPEDLIDRIDIVTGGESAVYGSDAVAGVVNFILKKNFDGFRIRGQGGISKYGDRPVDFVSTTFGKNFADGRGNFAVNAEYTHAGELFLRDRQRFAHNCGFEPTDDTVGEPPQGNGIPDSTLVCGNAKDGEVRNEFITNGGEVDIFGNGQTLAFDPNGNLVFSQVPTKNFLFAPDGALVFGDVVSPDPLGGSTLRETGDLAVGRNRYSVNVMGHFDVSDAFKPFIEGTYVHQKVFQEFQPTFFQGDLHTFFEGGFGTDVVPSLSCSNPFLTAQALSVLTNFEGLCGTDANGNEVGIVPISRFNVDLGARKEIDLRTTYRVVAGVTGDFNQDWHYEVSVNYGHTKQDNQQHNDLYVMNPDGTPGPFALALDAVSVDANGNILQPGDPGFGSNIVCRSTITDPGNGCVPLDLFGEGAPSPAAVNYVTRTSNLYQKASELDLLGFVSGDSSQWFNLQGGPVGFSVGGEYRRETAESHADPISATPGGTFFNAFPKFNPPAFKVSEAFGELNVPILKDLPFAHEFTVSGAARYSHYALTGNTFAWNANAIWSPVRDLRLRGNYSKSVRAPTLNDLFTPATVDFANITDPCEQSQIGNNPNRAANCAALGVPTTTLPGSPCVSAQSPVGSPFVNCLAHKFTLQVSDQGNPNLKAETGRSVTLGGVFTPRFLPGFSFSADYFAITVTNLISQLSAQTVINECVDLPTIQNQFCALVNPRNQFGLFGTPAAIQTGVNFAKQNSRGIDFDLSYRKNFANGQRLNLRGFATYTLERTNFTDVTNPNFGDRILSELGDPVFSGTAIIGYGIGKFDLRWTTRFIGSMTEFAYEDTHPFEGRPPQNVDVANNINTGPVWYHDIRVDYNINKYNFYVGIDNLFNRQPPFGGLLTGAGAGSGIYTNYGRFFYAGAVLDLK